MLAEVLASAQITHLVQLQSLQPKRNLPDDASWFAAAAMQPFEHLMLPAADVLAAGRTGCNQQYTGAFANGDTVSWPMKWLQNMETSLLALQGAPAALWQTPKSCVTHTAIMPEQVDSRRRLCHRSTPEH